MALEQTFGFVYLRFFAANYPSSIFTYSTIINILRRRIALIRQRIFTSSVFELEASCLTVTCVVIR